MNFIVVEDSKPGKVEAEPEPVSAPRRTSRQASDMVAAIAAQRFPDAPVKPADRRWALRKRTATPAFIAHAKNPQGMRCIVRDTSSSGALIEVLAGAGNQAEDVPDRLTLVFIAYKERSEVACAVMRRSGRLLGVRYVGPFHTFAAAQPAKPNAAGKSRKR